MNGAPTPAKFGTFDDDEAFSVPALFGEFSIWLDWLVCCCWFVFVEPPELFEFELLLLLPDVNVDDAIFIILFFSDI